MIRLGDNFIGCRFNLIQFRKKIIEINRLKKNIDIKLTVSIRCMTMNRWRSICMREKANKYVSLNDNLFLFLRYFRSKLLGAVKQFG